MTGSDLKHLVEKLDRTSPLFNECALILPELESGKVELIPGLFHFPEEMASTYILRCRRLSERGRGVGLAAEYFAHNVGQEHRFASVETAAFKGYAFFDPKLINLIAFPHAFK